MNENPSPAPAPAPPAPSERPLPDTAAGPFSPAAAAADGDQRDGARRPSDAERQARWRETRRWIYAIVVLALMAAIFWLYHALERNRGVLDMQARELAATQATLAETQRELKSTQQRFAELEERIEQVRAQRAALDQLYNDISRGRDDSILIEVERLISLAAQELQITGNVATAIAALQSADTRLARLERPQFVALRRALTRDVEKLRALPVVDAAGLALRLDQLAQGVDSWPMLAQTSLPLGGGKSAAGKAGAKAADAAPSKAAADPAATARTAEAAATTNRTAEAAAADNAAPGLWARLRAWVTREFGELIRIHEASAPEALLITEAQQQLLRQQLKLRLLDARYAALARNERVFRADVDDVQALLNKYFDTRAPAVAAALAQLKQLGQSPLAVEAPALTESTAALRALTGRR